MKSEQPLGNCADSNRKRHPGHNHGQTRVDEWREVCLAQNVSMSPPFGRQWTNKGSTSPPCQRWACVRHGGLSHAFFLRLMKIGDGFRRVRVRGAVAFNDRRRVRRCEWLQRSELLPTALLTPAIQRPDLRFPPVHSLLFVLQLLFAGMSDARTAGTARRLRLVVGLSSA